jgi:hypothetical protein
LNEVITPGEKVGSIIFEQIKDNADVVYAVYNERQVQFSPCIEVGDSTYYPVSDCPLSTPGKPRDYGTVDDLWSDIVAFLKEHLDLIDERYYNVLAAFILASWRSEDFTVAVYIFFLGPPASGKTRGLECLHRLCFRGIMSSNATPASIFHIMEDFHPTLILDETELYKTQHDIKSILNAGYRRGEKAIRTKQGKLVDGQPSVLMYDTFGFKAFAGIEELPPTLFSRCIHIPMQKATRPIKLIIDEEKADELRSKLLAYRFNNLGKPLPEPNLTSFTDGRVAEIMTPLLQVAPNDDVNKSLHSLAMHICGSRDVEEKTSIEARVLLAFLRSKKHMREGRVSTRSVTGEFNRGLPEKEGVSTSFIGRKLKALGLQNARMPSSKAGYYWNEDLISRLKKRYMLEPVSIHPHPSNGSEASNHLPNQLDHSNSEGSEGSEGSKSIVEWFLRVLRNPLRSK